MMLAAFWQKGFTTPSIEPPSHILTKDMSHARPLNPFNPNGISDCYQFDQSFSVLRVLEGILHFYSNSNRTVCKQTVENQNAASDLGLRSLPLSHKRTLVLYGLMAKFSFLLKLDQIYMQTFFSGL